MPTHCHKAMEILGKALVCLLVQPGEGPESAPVEAHGVWVILHPECGHHTIKVRLLSACPPLAKKNKWESPPIEMVTERAPEP